MVSQPIDIRKREPLRLDQVAISEIYKNDLLEVLIQHGEVTDRINALSLEISNYYQEILEPRESIDVVCVLKGAIKFYGSLLSGWRFEVPYGAYWVSSSRYGKDTRSKEKPKILFSEDFNPKGRHVLVVEDIIDEGYTLDEILKRIRSYNPKSVSLAVLLDKIDRRKIQPLFDQIWTGFIIPDKFVVGYGLDFNERYRGVPHIAVLKPEIYNKNK